MSGAHCARFPTCMEFSDKPKAPRCGKLDCPGKLTWADVFSEAPTLSSQPVVGVDQARHPSFNDAVEAAIKCVPTNWCDELLTGPNAPRGPLGGPDVERLLLAIIERLRSLKLPDYRGGKAG